MEYICYLFSYYHSFVGLRLNSGLWQDHLKVLFSATHMVFVVYIDREHFGRYREDENILRLKPNLAVHLFLFRFQ